jgi:hypothetical protein
VTVLLLLVAWAISVVWVAWLDQAAGSDPQGLLDPDAPAGPAMWLVPPPFELPVPGKELRL